MPDDQASTPAAERSHPAVIPSSAFPSRRIARRVLLGLCLLGSVACLGYWDYYRPSQQYRRGLAALAARDGNTVIREWRSLKSVPGYEAHAHHLAGALHVQSGRYEDALQELTQVPLESVISAQAMTLAAECHYRAGRFREAVLVARSALDKDSAQIDARRWLAAALYDMGLSSQAALELENLARDAPHDGRPFHLLGLIELDRQEYATAAQYFQKSLDRELASAVRGKTFQELATAQVKLEKYDDALAALAECPETAETLSLAVECHLGACRPDMARPLAERALQLAPTDFAALIVNARLLSSTGDDRAAVEMLKQAAQLHPYDSRVRSSLVQAYSRLGDEANAQSQQSAKELAESVENEFTVLYNQAQLHVDDAEVRYRLGMLARKMQMPLIDKFWFRAALTIQPDHAAARAALEEPAADTGVLQSPQDR